MKIGIITIHFGVNYGSALQTYALNNYIKEKYDIKNGVVEVINYIPPRYSKKRRYLNTNKGIPFCTKIIYSILSAPSTFLYNKIFSDFLKKNTSLSIEMNNHSQLKNRYCGFDMLIAGSDQIWNSDFNEGFDSAYFLDFGSINTIRCTYAASAGKVDFDNEEREQIKNALSLLDGISVRESQLREFLLNMEFKNVVHVLDPVFLLNQKRWGELAGKPIIDERYLFIYLLDGDTQNTVDIAVQIAKKYHLKTVMISFGHVWSNDNRVDYYLIRKKPEEFINLMLYSDFVITNSFHGAAFSINFEKQFLAFKRDKYNSRLDSLSALFKLENRFISSKNSIDIDEFLNKEIDYEIVNNIKNDLLNRSESYLKEMIGKIYEINK